MQVNTNSEDLEVCWHGFDKFFILLQDDLCLQIVRLGQAPKTLDPTISKSHLNSCSKDSSCLTTQTL